MDDLMKMLQDIRLNALREFLETDLNVTPEKASKANHRCLSMKKPFEKKLRLCLNPFSYGLANGKLRKLSQSDILLEEIKQIIDEEFGKLPPSIYKETFNHFKAEVTDPNYPVEVYIPEKHAKLLFGMRSSRLQLYRNTGILTFAKFEGSYCYPWTQLQELFG